MMQLGDELRVCAFCDRMARADNLVYYAMRRYAHGICLVEELPLSRLLALKTYPLGQLPSTALGEAGYLEAVLIELERRVG